MTHQEAAPGRGQSLMSTIGLLYTQVVCSLASISDDVPPVVNTTGVPVPEDHVTSNISAVGVATGVGVARCELTQPISNASSTLIQLVFDVDIDDMDVSRGARLQGFCSGEGHYGLRLWGAVC